MGGACSTYAERMGVTQFWWGNLKERGHLEDPCVDGRIIKGGSSGSVLGGHGVD